MVVETKRIWLWSQEKVFSPPALKSWSMTWVAGTMTEARLTVDINLKPLNNLDNITLNGNVLPDSSGSTGAHKIYDVVGYVQNGSNQLVVNYSLTLPRWPLDEGWATAYIDATADWKAIEPPVTPNGGIDWQVILLLGIAAVFFLAAAPVITPVVKRVFKEEKEEEKEE